MAFTALYTLSLLPGERRRLAGRVAILAGILGAALIYVQAFRIRVFCSLCTLVDLAAIVAAVAGAAYLAARGRGETTPEPLRDGAWMALGALAVSAPLLWPSLRPTPPVPPAIAKYHVPGKINVVEFVDFQCPHCRLFHPRLKAIIAEYGERVAFTRLDLPLKMHPLARSAARAHVCAVARGKGEAMADALFETADFEEAGLLKAGEKAGLDGAELRRCLAAPETEAAVVRSERILLDAKLLEGLPTTFVGSTMLVGTQEDATLRDAFDRAATDGPLPGVPGPVFIGVIAVGALAIVWFGRDKGEAARPASAPKA
jgi:predicted DsbA family dithiol-disulfide isomerase